MKLIKLLFLFLFSGFIFASCDFLDLSPELSETEKEKIITSDSIISVFADSALISPNPYEGLKQAAEKFKKMPQVEEIFFENNCLAVKYKKGGYIFYLITPEDSIEEKQSIPKFAKQLQSNIAASISDAISTYPRILVVNQQSNDLARASLNIYCKEIVELGENYGGNITYIKGNDFNFNFIKTEFKNYDAIFINTHGAYFKRTGNSWILTGQESTIKDIFKEGILDISWSEKNPISIFHIKECRNPNNDKDLNTIAYFALSNNYIDDNFNKNDFNNSFFYSGACQTMMDPELKFAKSLVSKGVKSVFGYDESTLTENALFGMQEYIRLMLKGYSSNMIIDSLPQEMKPQNYYENESEKNITCNIKTYPEDVDFSFNQYKLAQAKISSIISPEHIQLLKDMKMPVYDKGINPPEIDGVFLFSPVTLVSTNKSNDYEIGHVFSDVVFKIKTKNNFFIDISDYNSGSFSNSNDMVIVGDGGKNFTIYNKSVSIDKNNSSVYIVLAEIYSGTYENGSITNLNYGFVCVDDSHNDGTYVKEGTARVFVDNDFISESTTWSLVPAMKIKRSNNNKPDCPQAK